MNTPDHERKLQQQVEAGETPATTDGSLYQQVFDGLKQAPQYTLPVSFAASVIQRIQLRQQQSLRWEYFYLSLGVVVMVVACGIVFTLSGLTVNLGFLKGLNDYKWVMVFAAFFVILLQWVDRKVLHVNKD